MLGGIIGKSNLGIRNTPFAKQRGYNLVRGNMRQTTQTCLRSLKGFGKYRRAGGHIIDVDLNGVIGFCVRNSAC